MPFTHCYLWSCGSRARRAMYAIHSLLFVVMRKQSKTSNVCHSLIVICGHAEAEQDEQCMPFTHCYLWSCGSRARRAMYVIHSLLFVVMRKQSKTSNVCHSLIVICGHAEAEQDEQCMSFTHCYLWSCGSRARRAMYAIHLLLFVVMRKQSKTSNVCHSLIVICGHAEAEQDEQCM